MVNTFQQHRNLYFLPISCLLLLLPNTQGRSLRGDFRSFPERNLNEEWVLLTSDTFEDPVGWGSFEAVEGSRNAKRTKKDSAACDGEYSLMIKDDKGDSSSVYLKDPLDLSMYSGLRVAFQYFAESMERNDDFVLEYSPDGGESWIFVEQYVSGTHFENRQCYAVSATLRPEDNYQLTNNVKIRFRSDAGDRRDKVYIDTVDLYGLEQHQSTYKMTPSPTSSPLPSSTPSSQPSLTPTQWPTIDREVPSASPSIAASNHPSSPPSSGPTSAPSTMPSVTPSVWASSSPSATQSSQPSSVQTAEDICPKNRQYPPEKYSVAPFEDSNNGDGVEDDLNEISSLAFSSQTDAEGNRYAYMVSDKKQYSLKVIKFTENMFGSGEHLNGAGETVATYTLFTSPPSNGDWEDIALGPCTNEDNSFYQVDQVCIYIGDIGNNNEPKRKELYLYKFVEPLIDPINGPSDEIVQFAVIGYNYGLGFDQSDDRYYDAEAMFVDWAGVEADPSENPGDIYIVTKGTCSGGVGKIPADFHSNIGPNEAVLDLSIPLVADPPKQGSSECDDGPYRAWTGADMRMDGRLIALIRRGAPAAVYFFARTEDQSIASALSMSQCDYIAATSDGLTHEVQYEAVAFVDKKGSRFAEISECQGRCTPTLYQHELNYDSPGEQIKGPKSGWVTLTYDTFEDGIIGNYTIGGGNAVLSNDYSASECDGYCACENEWALRLNEDRGEASSIYHTVPHSCNIFDMLKVTFLFKFRGYDHLDTLFLEISLDGGTNYFIVGDWSHSVSETRNGLDSNLSNGECYEGMVLLDPTMFRVNSFGNDVRLRFRNSGNAGNDRVYINNISFEGHL